MRNKFLYCLLLIIVAIPCMIFAGCGDDVEKQIHYDAHGYEVNQENAVSFVTPGSWKGDGSFSGVSGYIKAGSTISYDIVLCDGYDADTLKIYNNGKEVNWTKSSSYDAEKTIETTTIQTYQLVGNVTIKNATEDVNLTATCDSKTISLTFVAKDGKTPTSEQETNLKNFVLKDGTNLFDALQSQDYSLNIKYHELKNGMILKSGKAIDYYSFSSNSEFMSMGWIEALYSKDMNLYKYSVNSAVTKNMQIEIDFDALTLNHFSVVNNAGKALSIKYNNVDINADGTFASDTKGYAYITLADLAGVDISNAELFCNGTKLQKYTLGGETYWTLPLSATPLGYVNYNSEIDASYYSGVYSYNLVLKGLDFTNSTTYNKITILASECEANKTWDDNFVYYDGENTVYYQDSYTFFYDLQQVSEKPNTISIIKNGDEQNKTLINIEDYTLKEEIQAKKEFVVANFRIRYYVRDENASHSMQNISEIWISIDDSASSEQVKYEILFYKA